MQAIWRGSSSISKAALKFVKVLFLIRCTSCCRPR